MWALSCLCVAGPCRELALTHNGVATVADALRKYRWDGCGSEQERMAAAAAQTASLSALEALCREHEPNQKAAAECGCLELAVAALREHEDSTEVVEAGCKALTSVVQKQPENQARCANCDLSHVAVTFSSHFCISAATHAAADK